MLNCQYISSKFLVWYIFSLVVLYYLLMHCFTLIVAHITKSEIWKDYNKL